MALRRGRPRLTTDSWLTEDKAKLDWLEDVLPINKTIFGEDIKTRRQRLLSALDDCLAHSTDPDAFKHLRSKWNRECRNEREGLKRLTADIPIKLHKALELMAKNRTLKDALCELIDDADGRRAETKAAMRKAVQEVRAKEEQKIHSAQYRMKDQLITSQRRIQELELQLDYSDGRIHELFTQNSMLRARFDLARPVPALSPEQEKEANKNAKDRYGAFLADRQKECIEKAKNDLQAHQEEAQTPRCFNSVLPLRGRQPSADTKEDRPDDSAQPDSDTRQADH